MQENLKIKVYKSKNTKDVINISLIDILVCSIAEHFLSSFVFCLALRVRQNKARLVKIYRDTTN